MKKIITLAMALLISGSVITSGQAHQDQSFTNINTAGIFEDTYDYFKYSPAYLPSFQKATLWTQLSNLYNAADDLFDGSASSNYYLLGGQMDLMGLGRLGVMIDWDSAIDAQSVTDINGRSDQGFASSTRVDYIDTDNDGVYDFRANRKAEIEKVNNWHHNDIHVAYGLGGIAGFDLGAALRINWNSFAPSWNDWNSNVSLKEKYESRVYDNLTGTLTQSEDQSREGKLEYGNGQYNLTLGGRSKGLMPNLDLVANVGAIIDMNGNDYDYTYEQTIDNDVANPLTQQYRKITEKGIEPGTSYYPGTGMGFLAEVRGDYQLTQNLVLIGEVGGNMVSRSISDAKQERGDIDRDVVLTGSNYITDEEVETDVDEYEGTFNNATFGVGIRAQYFGKGWKMGMGLRGRTTTSDQEITTTNTYTNVDTHSGEPILANNSTTTITDGMKSVRTDRTNSDILELPVGIVIDVLKNLPIQLGAMHRITISEDSNSYEVKEDTPRTTTTVDGTGSVTANSVTDVINAEHEYSDSTVESFHQTFFYSGLTWWPNESVQIDLQNITDLTNMSNWEISVSLHF